MSEVNVKIFFDESGSDDDPVKTMGGILIPSKVYSVKNIQQINNQLKNKEFRLHWTQYNGYHEEDKKHYLDTIMSFSKYLSLCSFNVIHYERPEKLNKDKFNNMVYSKLPERICYGLLRHQGANADIETDIFIEKANKYQSIELDKKLREQLNIQSIYRGEKYKVNKFYYKNKNEEIGVELTDLLLGIVRTIIFNKNSSRTYKAKNELVVEFLKIEEFFSFLSNIKYFEWKNSHQLKQIDFNKYIKLFLAQQENWLNYLEENSTY